jgi:hypothetical protein
VELAAELGRLRARVEQLERQLPEDARTTGVSAYVTRQGVRWRFAAERADGTITTRRGYRTRDAAARARDRLVSPAPLQTESSFARFWQRWLTDKRPYLTDGISEALALTWPDGRQRPS